MQKENFRKVHRDVESFYFFFFIRSVSSFPARRFADSCFVCDMIQIGACLIQTSFWRNFHLNCIHLERRRVRETENCKTKPKRFNFSAFFLCSSFFLQFCIYVLKCFSRSSSSFIQRIFFLIGQTHLIHKVLFFRSSQKTKR